jgi:hypothetical protein
MSTVSQVVFVDGGTRPRKLKTVSLMREDNIQRLVVAHLQRRAAKGVVYFHVPNGGKRAISEAAKMKRMGVLPGVPDLLLLRAGELFALELKAEQGRLSDDQRHMLAELAKAGATTATAYGLDHALALLEQWGIFEK